jgi:hypothetical protein
MVVFLFFGRFEEVGHPSQKFGIKILLFFFLIIKLSELRKNVLVLISLGI